MIPCEFSGELVEPTKKYLRLARECSLKTSDKFRRFCWLYNKPLAVRSCIHRKRELVKVEAK